MTIVSPIRFHFKVTPVRSAIGFLSAAVFGVGTVAAGEPAAVQIRSAVTVQPSNFVMHSVQARDVADRQRLFVQLRGPKLASEVVMMSQSGGAEPSGYLAWYDIGNAPPRRTTRHRITIGDSDPVEIAIGQPEYFLMPAQRITDGSPPELPPSIGFFKAFALDPSAADGLFEVLTRHAEVDDIDRAFPTHLAVPSEYWHHDDYTAYADQTTVLVICDSKSPAAKIRSGGAVTVLDSFGINRLDVTGGGPVVAVGELVVATAEPTVATGERVD